MADTLTLTNHIPVAVEGGGGSSSGIMVVHGSIVSTEEESFFKLDKTWQEIKEAVDNDIFVVIKYYTEDEGSIDVSWSYVLSVEYEPDVDPELDPDLHHYSVDAPYGVTYVSDTPDGDLISKQGGK